MDKSKHRRNEDALAMLAQNIRNFRKQQNMTIQELAFRIDADYSQVSRMERGKVNFSISLLFDLAKALQVTPAQLVDNLYRSHP